MEVGSVDTLTTTLTREIRPCVAIGTSPSPTLRIRITAPAGLRHTTLGTTSDMRGTLTSPSSVTPPRCLLPATHVP